MAVVRCVGGEGEKMYLMSQTPIGKKEVSPLTQGLNYRFFSPDVVRRSQADKLLRRRGRCSLQLLGAYDCCAAADVYRQYDH